MMVQYENLGGMFTPERPILCLFAGCEPEALLADSFQLFDQRGPLDPQELGGAVAIPARALERARDQILFNPRKV